MSINSSFSKIARNGSAVSTSSTSGSVDSSSHHHFFSHLPPFSKWFQNTMSTQNHRHERIALGTMRTGMAIMTREMLEMHINQAPDVRGMLDYAPVADGSKMEFIGWRQKLGTWPSTKSQASVARRRAST
ncbi:uncharacterized protein RSE6_00412 [Rhynchosporium secalis]|uniref:Uncharacterized protein n=1 Tax=Rhynchosporium secalis TaxID=38038 RepID=A0A1E1LV79_RHYSE|nr:uncharacterized protein RSE6_00412 [Rhynchosporium secalis]